MRAQTRSLPRYPTPRGLVKAADKAADVAKGIRALKPKAKPSAAPNVTSGATPKASTVDVAPPAPKASTVDLGQWGAAPKVKAARPADPPSPVSPSVSPKRQQVDPLSPPVPRLSQGPKVPPESASPPVPAPLDAPAPALTGDLGLAPERPTLKYSRRWASWRSGALGLVAVIWADMRVEMDEARPDLKALKLEITGLLAEQLGTEAVISSWAEVSCWSFKLLVGDVNVQVTICLVGDPYE